MPSPTQPEHPSRGATGSGLATRLPLSRIGKGMKVVIATTAEERQDLAKRFSLLSLSALKGDFDVRPDPSRPGAWVAEGHIDAVLEQPCVITGAAVRQDVSEDFPLRFIPEEEMEPDEAVDIETLLASERDDVPYTGHTLELGKALAEQLALCLDPYPRAAGAGMENHVDLTPPDEGTEGAGEVKRPNPFAALAALKKDGGPGEGT
ncbi:DUF177 domain-containing protein [Formicincola oecophyllae]|uniref:DUF177 domain-containing protein n=1 Tax=Formicincola oecophyllae TaxID=2558361 RepID=A0A4Y6U959_9PROT|nr:DUF177 domain-containing protein [Formicincola oecophyllae]QDH12986.1 DUF177 domain-containing protein [Formicincola oecophyllae]